MNKPVLTLTAGAAGSGKSTLLKALRPMNLSSPVEILAAIDYIWLRRLTDLTPKTLHAPWPEGHAVSWEARIKDEAGRTLRFALEEEVRLALAVAVARRPEPTLLQRACGALGLSLPDEDATPGRFRNWWDIKSAPLRMSYLKNRLDMAPLPRPS